MPERERTYGHMSLFKEITPEDELKKRKKQIKKLDPGVIFGCQPKWDGPPSYKFYIMIDFLNKKEGKGVKAILALKENVIKMQEGKLTSKDEKHLLEENMFFLHVINNG
jgi:hypothetical protein